MALGDMKIDFIIPSDTFFNLIKPVITNYNLKVFFRRYESSNHASEWYECPYFDTTLAKIYNEGGYVAIYITKTKKPVHKQDWSFTDKAEDELIEITGGRTIDDCIELSKMRVVSKKSNIKNIFKQLRDIIISNSAGSQVLFNGHLYNNIYYINKVWEKKVCYTIGDDKIMVSLPQYKLE